MAFERRLLPASGSGRRALLASIAFGIGSSALVVGQAWLLARLVATSAAGDSSIGAPGLLMAALAGAALLRAATAWGAETTAAAAAADVRQSLRAGLTSKLFDLGPAFVSGERSGELANTLVGGVESTDAYVASYLPQLALSIAVPLLVGTAVFRADPLSGVVLALTWPLIPLFMYLVGGVARERTRARWVTLSRMSARFLDAVQGIPTLVTLGRAGDEAGVIARASEQGRAVTMGVLRVAFLSALTLEWLATLSVAIVAVELGLRLLYGRIAFEAALFVLVVAPEFHRPLRALGAAFHAAMAGREACGRISELLDTPARAASPPSPARRAPIPPSGAIGLSLEQVSFRYSADRTPALTDVSFRVAPGSVVALVGPSGAGKSTIAHLVVRFISPGSGRVVCGGHALEEFDVEQWRRQVAWLPQRPSLFHGAVIDNLLLARPGASASEIERAVSLAHADEFIRRLPRGLLAPVGEGGVRLSGGQAQRLALARAFLKDAPLVVLDEPTSHLDPDNDALVTDAVRTLSRGRTVLLIAHRLTTVSEAGLIVILSAGRVVEQGRHAELMQARGLYSRMVAASGVTA